MIKKYLFAVLLLLPLFGSSQNNGCIDSVSLNQFYPSTFNTPVNQPVFSSFTPQRDALDNLYTSGGSGSGFNDSYWSIIKFDADNKLVWYKNYKTDIFSTFRGGGNLHDIEPNGNLIFTDNLGNPANPGSSWSLISKTDSAGNFLWSKTIKNGTNPDVTGAVGFQKVNDNGELFAVGRYFDNPEEPLVVALDAAGNLKWNKRYKHVSVPKFHLRGLSITVENNNNIAVAIQYYYDADIITDPAAKHGFQIFKINTTDGSITSQVSFMYYNDIAGNNPNSATLRKLNYDPIAKRFLICSAGGSGDGNSVLSLFDENLNHLKTRLVSTSSLTSPRKREIGKHNQICLIRDYQGPVHSFHYTTIDNELNLVSQKYINLETLGFPNRNFGVDLSYKKNGMLSFQVGTYSSVGSPPQYFYIQDQSAFYNNISTCVGIDSLVYSVFPIYTNIVANPLIEEAGSTPLTITNNFPDFPPIDFPLPKTLICKEISICDTIKLFGTKYHCLNNPLDSFKIYRNPLCLRKTNWQVDTPFIKILSQTDTSLHVQYLQPYRGSIKVGFGGCSLTDEIPIEVYEAQTGVNLGNDTMHCPGKTITLRAGKNFKTYLWQDGSSKDSLVAAQPGMYHITATDSCGNVFKDTLLVNPFDVVLKTDYPQWLCPKDTVTFNLPNQLYNYSWFPTIASTLNNFTWRLFPSSTTTYSISGERLPGCIVSDTVLINVKPNCLPDYIYFPTGFTPNGDGLNDTYKPGINGQLVLYEFMIYNRYGQLVFRTTDAARGWDGSFKNSINPLTGSYVWMCKYQFTGRPVQQEQGTFVLIR